MSPKYIFSAVLFASLVACGSAGSSDDPSSDPAAAGDEQDITSGRSMPKGAWVRDENESGGFGTQALYLAPNGEYFADSQTILLGVKTPPPKDRRDTGTFTASAKTNTLTLKGSDGISTVYSFTYTPARVVLGMPAKGGNGGGPPMGAARLVIQRKAPECKPGQACSHIAFPNESYFLADSYCRTDDDCEREQKEKTWEPISQGRATCETGADAFHGKGEVIAVNRCEAVVFQK